MFCSGVNQAISEIERRFMTTLAKTPVRMDRFHGDWLVNSDDFRGERLDQTIPVLRLPSSYGQNPALD